jgi:hypothetical protein
VTGQSPEACRRKQPSPGRDRYLCGPRRRARRPVGALLCHLTVQHLSAAPLVASRTPAPSAGAVLAVAGFVYFIEEKFDLF